MICYPSLCLCAQGRFLFLNAPTIFLEVNTRMPNAKVLSEKQAIVAELTEKIQKASAGVLVDYKGITVEEDTALRRECRENGVDYAVVKNTLLRFAFNNTGLNELDDLLNGTTSLALCEEDVVRSRPRHERLCQEAERQVRDQGRLYGRQARPLWRPSSLWLPSPLCPFCAPSSLGTMLAPITGLACGPEADRRKGRRARGCRC